MRSIAIDANVIVRFLTGDPPDMAQQALDLFTTAERGGLTLVLDDIVLAEVVWVLTSFYKHAVADVARTLQEFLAHEIVYAEDKALLFEALTLFAEHNVDFADALLAARMRHRGIVEIASFDNHFDRLPGIRRLDPGDLVSRNKPTHPSWP